MRCACRSCLASGALFLGEPIHGEMEGATGTIHAARRKLQQELNVPPEQVGHAPPLTVHNHHRTHYPSLHCVALRLPCGVCFDWAAANGLLSVCYTCTLQGTDARGGAVVGGA